MCASVAASRRGAAAGRPVSADRRPPAGRAMVLYIGMVAGVFVSITWRSAKPLVLQGKRTFMVLVAGVGNTGASLISGAGWQQRT